MGHLIFWVFIGWIVIVAGEEEKKGLKYVRDGMVTIKVIIIALTAHMKKHDVLRQPQFNWDKARRMKPTPHGVGF